jgi:quercetin dioxygenase-like cupin family protein
VGKIDWDDQEFNEVRPGIFGATFHTPQLTATLYRYGAGSTWEEHQHAQDQVTTVLSGDIDFIVNGEKVHLAAGQTALLPGGTPHSAEATNECVTINVLTLRKDTPSVS